MENRVAVLERKVANLEEELLVIKKMLNLSSELPEGREWLSNTAGDWSIKVVYPGVFAQTVDNGKPTAGFPKNRKKTAEQVSPGQMMFVYATHPIKRVIGMTKVTSSMQEVGGKWPYSVDLEWVIGPKQGVTFADAELDIRPRVGDTLYAISDEAAQRLIDLLNAQPDLSDQTLEYLANEYRNMVKEVVTHSEAVSRLRRAGMNDAADALEDFKASDGSVRGWDEAVERGQRDEDSLHKRFPEARKVIWPEQYGK